MTHLTEQFIKRLHEIRIGRDWDSTESIFKVREDIGCGLWVYNFDEEGVWLYPVVEAIEIEEMNKVSTIIGNSSNPEIPCIKQTVTWSE